MWSRNLFREKGKIFLSFQQLPLIHSCGGYNTAPIYSYKLLIRTSWLFILVLPQPASVSCKIFSRPEFAHCLKFLLETDAKEVTKRSPIELMLSVPVNFVLMKHVWVTFSPFPWQPTSEMWKGFNPLSSLPCSASSSHSDQESPYLCEIQAELLLQVTTWSQELYTALGYSNLHFLSRSTTVLARFLILSFPKTTGIKIRKSIFIS